MKKIFYTLALSTFMFSCGSDDDGNNEKVKTFCKCVGANMEVKSSDECKELAAEMDKRLNSGDENSKAEALQEYKEMYALCK